MTPLRLRAGLALDADRVLGPVDLLVSDGRIAAIEPLGSAAGAGERLLGGEGMLLMPGLVNAHTHLAMTLLRGVGADEPLDRWLGQYVWPAEARMTAQDVYWGTLLGAVEGMAGGTTAFVDMYFEETAAARACVDAGVRASLAIGLAGEGEAFERTLRKAADEIVAFRGRGDDRVELRLGPHAPYTCPPPSLARVAEVAAEIDSGIHIHLSETHPEVATSLARYGQTPVAVAAASGLLARPSQVAHVVAPGAGDSALLAAFGAVVAHCPASNLQLGSGISPVLDLVAAGVTIALGTDGAASAPGLDMFDAMRLAWLLAKGSRQDPRAPTAREALAWATLGGAAALGYGDLGRLRVGDRADLLLVDLERPGLWPLPADPYAAVVGGVRAGDVHSVIVAGAVRVEAHRPVGVDLRVLRDEARARALRLRGG